MTVQEEVTRVLRQRGLPQFYCSLQTHNLIENSQGLSS